MSEYIGQLIHEKLGVVRVVVRNQLLTSIQMGATENGENSAEIAPYIQALEEYLNGTRLSFELPIDWSVMTPFQANVLRLVNLIPYGETRSYGEIARELNKPTAARAVGMANARNPIPLVIPCHRVIGHDGKLCGYSAPNGIETKAWLLTLEYQVAQNRYAVWPK